MEKHDAIFGFKADLEKGVKKFERLLEKGKITEEQFLFRCYLRYMVLWDEYYNDSKIVTLGLIKIFNESIVRKK